MDIPELEELAKLLPERDEGGRFFWQDYVDRIAGRFDGLPAPDGGDSFVRACLAAGCRAVPVMERSTLWTNRAPPKSDRRARGIFEFRVRLGLFLGASLRCLAHNACRLRATVGDAEWHPLTGSEASFRAFLEAHTGKPDIAWSTAAPRFREVCLCAMFFLRRQEVLLLSPPLALELLGCLDPDEAQGLFGRMLFRDGQIEGAEVDVAGVFLEALAEAVDRKVLRVNTPARGHLFVTPAFWLLTTPVGLDCVKDLLRTRRQGRRYDLPRRDIFGALQSQGCLAAAGGRGNAAWVCEVRAAGRHTPLLLHGVPIRPDALPVQPEEVPLFKGAITLIKENDNGSDTA